MFCLLFQVPRPDGKPDDLGLLMLDEPSVKQSDPTVMSLWLSEDSKQHGTPEVCNKDPTDTLAHQKHHWRAVHFTPWPSVASY